MGIFSRTLISNTLFGYSDKQAHDTAFSLIGTGAPKVSELNALCYARCTNSPQEHTRLLFCVRLYNLCAALSIIDQRYYRSSTSARQMQLKVLSAFRDFLDKSPHNLLISDYVVDKRELSEIVQREGVSETYRTNEHSIFNMMWDRRAKKYLEYLPYYPELQRGFVYRDNPGTIHNSAITNESNDYRVSYRDEVLAIFIRDFAGVNPCEFEHRDLVDKFLFQCLENLLAYLWPPRYRILKARGIFHTYP
jgi:hypothetical protein